MSIRVSLSGSLLTLVVTGLLSTAPAIAQTAPAPTAAPTRRDMMLERRITDLHAKLKITPAEEKPFNDFAVVMRENVHSMDEVLSKRQITIHTASAVEQMKAYADMTQAHAEDVSRLVGPFSTLYAALSPEQKKLADQSFREFSMGPRAGRRAGG